MARIADLADKLTRRKGLLAARAVLFPELGNEPAVRLTEGVLRAPPRGWRRTPVLSACATEVAVPSSLPTGLTTPTRVLDERGWESPALLARAAASRKALVAARVGGAWWDTGAEREMPEGRLAVVALAEPTLAGVDRTAGPETEAAMLEAALSAYPPRRVVVLAPSWSARRPCAP
ncbi:MAG TPA: hypothetical protein VHG31_03990, partial [Stellaceae bacterium]|nr:hypothetical protein [Stellaceae bacterium]